MYSDHERVGLIQVRLVAPLAKKITKKPQRQKDGDKNLCYSDCTPEIQKGLEKARAAEWQKWRKFNASVVIGREDLDSLRADGAKVYPMQWIETDKNAHKRQTNMWHPS
jgi:hypothetical protein